MFARLIALLMSLTLGLTLNAVTHAQTPVARQTTRAQSLTEDFNCFKSQRVGKQLGAQSNRSPTRDVMLLA
jgi:hypothetical protein